jgi:hypothetical protein
MTECCILEKQPITENKLMILSIFECICGGKVILQFVFEIEYKLLPR